MNENTANHGKINGASQLSFAELREIERQRSANPVITQSHQKPNPFRQFWDLGYRRLLPVVPADAGLRSAGKRPGLKGPEGWYGQSAASFDANEELLELWARMGAG